MQLLTHPHRQKKQCPQNVSTLTATRSPGEKRSTTDPTLSTTPTNSWPTVIPGTALGTAPALMWRSLVHIEAVVTRTTASPGSTTPGFGLSLTSNLPFST